MSCHLNQTTVIREDFKKYYDQYKVQGSFVLYDSNHDKYIVYHPGQLSQSFTPASTFKICNSLIGLETGVIKDENFIIPWDKVVRNPVWDQDHDLKTAFKNSTVWYYQELARRVGGEKMKFFLDKTKYGNADTTGGIDKFWLEGGLRISPMQQIDFLKRLHQNNLPFSQRSMDIVKNIMIRKDTLDYVLRAKFGWGGQESKDIGWYVGYIIKKDQVYFFANCIQDESKNVTEAQDAIRFDHARNQIAFNILSELNIIQLSE
jgi:beta-lactamase class D